MFLKNCSSSIYESRSLIFNVLALSVALAVSGPVSAARSAREMLNSLPAGSTLTPYTTPMYLPISPGNPGGTKGYAHNHYFKNDAESRHGFTTPLRDPPGGKKGSPVKHGKYEPKPSKYWKTARQPGTVIAPPSQKRM